MKKTNICFLLGFAGSGKDTVGETFQSQGFTRVSFADKVKEEYADSQNIDVKVLHEQGPIKEHHREGVINYAEGKRKDNPLHWLDTAFKPYKDGFEFKEGLNLIVTDCRRIDEIKWVYEMKNLIATNNFDLLNPYFLNIYLFYVERELAERTDKDVLTHDAVYFAKGINYTRSKFIDGIIRNDKGIKELQDKTLKLVDVYDFV